jgi:hypothetical protein
MGGPASLAVIPCLGGTGVVASTILIILMVSPILARLRGRLV